MFIDIFFAKIFYPDMTSFRSLRVQAKLEKKFYFDQLFFIFEQIILSIKFFRILRAVSF